MKRLLSIITVFIGLSLYSTDAMAQATPNVTAAADVITALTTAVPQNVDFGVIDDDLSTTTPTITTTGTSSGILDDTDAKPAFVTFAVQANFEVSVTIPATVSLTHTTSSDELVFTPAYEIIDAVLAAGADPSANSATGTTVTGTSTVTYSDGDGTIIIGGTLAEGVVTDGLDTGTYQGDFDVSIDYSIAL